ncbi:hypothetical protein [Burkholderia ubonensis]|uniref:hypothetical protein n=1 Tax=Burkholderia ubonensis TaxID=101571 RepID=UPI0011788C8B|nr:hypothetical protein [Burkholderia ubonensis]
MVEFGEGESRGAGDAGGEVIRSAWAGALACMHGRWAMAPCLSRHAPQAVAGRSIMVRAGYGITIFE